MEGLLLGGMGAAAALAAISVLYSTLSRWLGSDLAGIAGVGQLRFLGLIELAVMVRADWPWGPPRERWHREPSDDIR